MSGPPSAPPRPEIGSGPAPGEVIAGKYVVESLLGVGGMGLVVSARHMQLNQSVAIKLLRPGPGGGSLTSRFLREARAAASIRCEHVARVLDVGTLDSGLPFIVMERLIGCDLAALLEARGRLAPAEAVSLILQACEAIGEAHALGIVHRDLKPSNIFVTSRTDGSPLVKVLDFGISKMQDPLAFTGADATLTASGSVLGSPAYMSPEQIRSARGTDARSDVWAMGVILYELVTGRNPFIGETLGDTLVKIASESVTPLRLVAPDVPAELAELIARCLVRDPGARTASIAELAKGLLPFAAQDMSAFVDRIVKVAATSRPVSITPPEGDRSEARATSQQQPDVQPTQRTWQEAFGAPRRLGSAWAALAGVVAIASIGAAGWLRRGGAPSGSQAIEAAPAEGAAVMGDERGAARGERHTATIATAAGVGTDSGVASAVDASVPAGRDPRLLGQEPDRRRGHHASPPPAGESSATATPAATGARSLDDLLEGRH